MMDFLKQDESKIPAVPQQGQVPQQPSGQDGFIATKAQEKTVKQGTMMLAIIFGAGLLCLWFMVKKTAPQAAAAATATQDTAIEVAIAQVTGTKAEFFKSIEDVVSKFKDYSYKKQVRVNELQKNPFALERFARESTPVRISQTARPSGDQAGPESQRSQLEQQGMAMQLQSIMKSPRGNCCMIDDKILNKGESINGWKVEKITNDSVELSAEEMKIVLKIASEG